MDPIKVEEIKLNFTLPDKGIGIVTMQPFVELCIDEPFRWQNNKKGKQIDRIIRTLEIAKQRDHGCEKTHFTIFPEYSIPGLEGIRKIQETLRSDQRNGGTIVIGGIDGLTKGEYSTLCNENMMQVHDKNKPEEVRDDEWINCCIMWMKRTNGSLQQWVQPKLSPSWPERNIVHSRMFTGRSVYVFSGKFENQTKCRFLSLLCFDWVGPIGKSYGIRAVLSEINNYWRDANTREEMNLVFVLQFNPDPNHQSFLGNAKEYFKTRAEYPFVNRDGGIIIFVNAAGGALPGKHQDYGYSSLISSPMASYGNKGCPPTFALTSQKLRGTDSLGRCKEALFREMGACIHSFRFHSPSFLNLDVEDRYLPIDEAIVHAIDDGIDDPRVPSRSVPAAVKWINDQLDGVVPFLENKQVHPLKNSIAKAHRDLCQEIRRQPSEFLCRYIVMSSCGIEKRKDKWIEIKGRRIHNIDNWDENEEQNLKTVVCSLSIMKVCGTLEVSGSDVHATIKIQDRIIDIIVVSGETHEKCFEYAKSKYAGSDQRFVIVVIRNISNMPWNKKFKSIFKSEKESTEKDPNITDPDSRFNCCGYEDLIDSCFCSQNLSELNSKITEVIEV